MAAEANPEIDDREPVDRADDSPAAGPIAPVSDNNKALGAQAGVEDEPQPHRRARIRALKGNLLVTVLLCWLSIMKPVTTTNVFPLAAGIHLLKTRLVSINETDLSFTLRSGLNVTQEIGRIKDTMKEFNSVCEETTALDEQIATYCKQLAETLGQEASSMSKKLTDVARKKRNVLAAVARSAGTAVVKAASKNAGSLIVAGYIFYQDYQIDNLNHKVGELNQKMKKLATIVAISTYYEVSIKETAQAPAT